MLDAIIKWSLNNRLAVLAIALLLCLWGSIETAKMPTGKTGKQVPPTRRPQRMQELELGEDP